MAGVPAGLHELDYVEGRTIALEPRWADDRHEKMSELVAELVRLKVDVILAAATPANLAAKAGAGKIPVVMVAVSDPTRIGVVASLSRPGGNMTRGAGELVAAFQAASRDAAQALQFTVPQSLLLRADRVIE